MKKISRKDFLKITGGAAAGALTGIIMSGTPARIFNKLTELSQNGFDIPAGEQRFLNTVCLSCPEQCQISLRAIGDRLVKIESSNFFCPFGQASLQQHYHPERVLHPLKRLGEKGSGNYEAVSWEDAVLDIAEKINQLIAIEKTEALAAITCGTNINSSSMLSPLRYADIKDETPFILAKFLETLGSPHCYTETSIEELELASLGGILHYDLKKADTIFSFGAAIFDGWKNPAAANLLLKEKKPEQKIVFIGTNCNRTASLADEWIPVKPGTEAVFAIGMAKYLFNKKRLSPIAVNPREWISIAESFDDSTIANITGVAFEKISEIAEQFYAAKNPAAIAGSGARSLCSSSAELMAVYALNTMVRTNSVSLLSQAKPNYQFSNNKKNVANKTEKYAGLDTFIHEGSFDILFINDTNPVYDSVIGNELVAKMQKSFVVSLSSMMDESSIYADYILPTTSPLEKLHSEPFTKALPVVDDSIIYSIKQEGDVKNGEDIILMIAEKILLPLRFNRTFSAPTPSRNFAFNTTRVLEKLNSLKSTGNTEYPLVFMPLDLHIANNNHALALPYISKSLDKHVIDNNKLKLHINKLTAEKYSLSEGESVDLKSQRGKTGPFVVHITDTIAPDVVAAPFGFGHSKGSVFAKNKGVKINDIMNTNIDPITGAANLCITQVKLA